MADGYFLMLAPLTLGIHILTYGGGASAFPISLSEADTITVGGPPPTITAQPADQTVSTGANATFSVSATAANPPLHFQWQFNGTNLFGATNNTLTISNAQAANIGDYRATITDSFGFTNSRVAYLTLSDIPPSVTLQSFFNPGVSGTSVPEVYALAEQTDGKILVGGYFTTLGGKSRNYIGRLNPDGTLDDSFNPGANAEVFAIAVQVDGKILVGGSFTSLGGQTRNYIGRLNADGTLDSTFNSGADSPVFSLMVQADGKILVGGLFSTLDGQSCSGIGRLNSNGTLDNDFNPGANGYVASMAIQEDGKIIIGGSFVSVGGVLRVRIARLNGDGTLDSTFDPAANGPVFAVTLQSDGKILVGGQFTQLDGQPRNNIGRLDADGTLDSSFDPGATGGSTDPFMQSMVLQADGKILVGGSFAFLSGQPHNHIARLNSDGTLDSSFNLMASSWVLSLAVQADGKILVAGRFGTFGGQPRNRIARLNNSGSMTQALDYNGESITWLRGGNGAELWRITFEHSVDGLTWTNLGAGTRLPGGWQLANQSLPAAGILKARGYASGGFGNASGWFLEKTLSAPWPLYLRLVHVGSSVVLSWSGGQGPYQVQQTADISQPGSWQNVGVPVQTNSILLPVGPGPFFYRVGVQQ